MESVYFFKLHRGYSGAHYPCMSERKKKKRSLFLSRGRCASRFENELFKNSITPGARSLSLAFSHGTRKWERAFWLVVPSGNRLEIGYYYPWRRLAQALSLSSSLSYPLRAVYQSSSLRPCQILREKPFRFDLRLNFPILLPTHTHARSKPTDVLFDSQSRRYHFFSL